MIETERLILRQWCPEDRAPFTAMCRFAAIQRYLGEPQIARIARRFPRLGFGRRPDLDFGHLLFAPEHPLHRHIAYGAEQPAR